MAKFANIALTNSGMQLINRIIYEGGQSLVFKKLCLGDGILEEGENPAELTALKNEIHYEEIGGFTRMGEDYIEISAEVSSSCIPQDIKHRELGIVVQDGEREVLLAYGNAGEKYDYIPRTDPDAGEATIFKKIETRLKVNDLTTTFRDVPTDHLMTIEAFYSRVNEILPGLVEESVTDLASRILQIGEVTTLGHECSATASLDYCSEGKNYFLNLGIPRGWIQDLADYSGPVNIKDEGGRNIISYSNNPDRTIKIGANCISMDIDGDITNIKGSFTCISSDHLDLHGNNSIQMSVREDRDKVIEIGENDLTIGNFQRDFVLYADRFTVETCSTIGITACSSSNIFFDAGEMDFQIQKAKGILHRYEGKVDISDGHGANILLADEGIGIQIGGEHMSTSIGGAHVEVNSPGIDLNGDVSMTNNQGSRIFHTYDNHVEIGARDHQIDITGLIGMHGPQGGQLFEVGDNIVTFGNENSLVNISTRNIDISALGRANFYGGLVMQDQCNAVYFDSTGGSIKLGNMDMDLHIESNDLELKTEKSINVSSSMDEGGSRIDCISTPNTLHVDACGHIVLNTEDERIFLNSGRPVEINSAGIDFTHESGMSITSQGKNMLRYSNDALVIGDWSYTIGIAATDFWVNAEEVTFACSSKFDIYTTRVNFQQGLTIGGKELLEDYKGPVNIKTSDNKDILSYNSDNSNYEYISIGNGETNFYVTGKDVSMEGYSSMTFACSPKFDFYGSKVNFNDGLTIKGKELLEDYTGPVNIKSDIGNILSYEGNQFFIGDSIFCSKLYAAHVDINATDFYNNSDHIRIGRYDNSSIITINSSETAGNILSDYSGPIKLSDENGRNVLSVNDGKINFGDSLTPVVWDSLCTFINTSDSFGMVSCTLNISGPYGKILTMEDGNQVSLASDRYCSHIFGATVEISTPQFHNNSDYIEIGHSGNASRIIINSDSIGGGGCVCTSNILANYSGPVNIADECGKNILSVVGDRMFLGNQESCLYLEGHAIHLCSDDCVSFDFNEEVSLNIHRNNNTLILDSLSEAMGIHNSCLGLYSNHAMGLYAPIMNLDATSHSGVPQSIFMAGKSLCITPSVYIQNSLCVMGETELQGSLDVHGETNFHNEAYKWSQCENN